MRPCGMAATANGRLRHTPYVFMKCSHLSSPDCGHDVRRISNACRRPASSGRLGGMPPEATQSIQRPVWPAASRTPYDACDLSVSCPGLAPAPTTFPDETMTWMAGTRPAMTQRNGRMPPRAGAFISSQTGRLCLNEPLRAWEPLEPHELTRGHPHRLQRVLRCVGIGVAQRHAADHDLFLGQAQHRTDRRMVVRP